MRMPRSRSATGGRVRRTVLLLAAVVMAVGALATVALGTAALLDLGPFATPEPRRIEVADRLGDCRDARLDTGDSCDAGADIESISLWLSDANTLAVELRLTEAPNVGPLLAWTAEFYVDAANAHTDGGVICVLSNLPPDAARDQAPAKTTDSYPLDPNTVPRQPLPAGACNGSLQDASAKFSINVAGQPDETPFRLIGLVRVEHPDDPERRGTEDDFLVRASLADLRR